MYKKSFARNEVCAILHIPGIRENFCANLQSFVWRRHLGVPLRGTNMTARNQKKHVFEFSYKILNTSLEEFMKIKVIFILRQGMFRLQNLKKLVTFLAHVRAFSAVSWMQRLLVFRPNWGRPPLSQGLDDPPPTLPEGLDQPLLS